MINLSLLIIFRIKDFLYYTHHFIKNLEAALTLFGLTLNNNPFVFGEMDYIHFSTLLMSA